MQGQDVISRQFFQPDLKLDWVMHPYIELGAVTKGDNHSGHLIVGDFDFLDNLTGDRAIGPPTANRFRFSQYAPPQDLTGLSSSTSRMIPVIIPTWQVGNLGVR